MIERAIVILFSMTAEWGLPVLSNLSMHNENLVLNGSTQLTRPHQSNQPLSTTHVIIYIMSQRFVTAQACHRIAHSRHSCPLTATNIINGSLTPIRPHITPADLAQSFPAKVIIRIKHILPTERAIRSLVVLNEYSTATVAYARITSRSIP